MVCVIDDCYCDIEHSFKIADENHLICEKHYRRWLKSEECKIAAAADSEWKADIEKRAWVARLSDTGPTPGARPGLS